MIETFAVATPIGAVTLTVRDGNLAKLAFSDDRVKAEDPIQSPAARAIAGRLRDYFDGALDALDAIPVAAEGTPFQKRVWRALREIPVGETVAYGELARRIGRPGAARAVARANATNPVAVVVPCNRVIGDDDKLRGYAFGLSRKEWLLAHEGALVARTAARSKRSTGAAVSPAHSARRA